MEELKPCMKCHGTREIEVHVQEGGPGWEETWEGTVTCGTCGNGFLTGNYGKGGFTKEQVRQRVIESWNTRATDPLMEEMARALEDAIGLNGNSCLANDERLDQWESLLQKYNEQRGSECRAEKR